MSAQPSFDRVARLYRWAEYLSLGPLLTRTREHFLPKLGDRRRAFVLGDGDGRFLARLLHENPQLSALAVDTSAAMLSLLRQRCEQATHSQLTEGNTARLRTAQADALTILAPADTDLIVTHFFLDCFTQEDVTALARRLFEGARPGTLWLLSDFRIPRRAILRPLAAIYIRALYFAFRVLTGLRTTRLPDTEHALAAAGFTRIERYELCFGLLYTELWRKR